jgi:hypothetical protein
MVACLFPEIVKELHLVTQSAQSPEEFQEGRPVADNFSWFLMPYSVDSVSALSALCDPVQIS